MQISLDQPLDPERTGRRYDESVFSVKVSVTVPNLDLLGMEVPCPLCELTTPTTMGSIRLSRTIICRGCHANIRLQDHMASFHRFKRMFEASLRSLER